MADKNIYYFNTVSEYDVAKKAINDTNIGYVQNGITYNTGTPDILWNNIIYIKENNKVYYNNNTYVSTGTGSGSNPGGGTVGGNCNCGSGSGSGNSGIVIADYVRMYDLSNGETSIPPISGGDVNTGETAGVNYKTFTYEGNAGVVNEDDTFPDVATALTDDPTNVRVLLTILPDGITDLLYNKLYFYYNSYSTYNEALTYGTNYYFVSIALTGYAVILTITVYLVYNNDGVLVSMKYVDTTPVENTDTNVFMFDRADFQEGSITDIPLYNKLNDDPTNVEIILKSVSIYSLNQSQVNLQKYRYNNTYYTQLVLNGGINRTVPQWIFSSMDVHASIGPEFLQITASFMQPGGGGLMNIVYGSTNPNKTVTLKDIGTADDDSLGITVDDLNNYENLTIYYDASYMFKAFGDNGNITDFTHFHRSYIFEASKIINHDCYPQLLIDVDTTKSIYNGVKDYNVITVIPHYVGLYYYDLDTVVSKDIPTLIYDTTYMSFNDENLEGLLKQYDTCVTVRFKADCDLDASYDLTSSQYITLKCQRVYQKNTSDGIYVSIADGRLYAEFTGMYNGHDITLLLVLLDDIIWNLAFYGDFNKNFIFDGTEAKKDLLELGLLHIIPEHYNYIILPKADNWSETIYGFNIRCKPSALQPDKIYKFKMFPTFVNGMVNDYQMPIYLDSGTEWDNLRKQGELIECGQEMSNSIIYVPISYDCGYHEFDIFLSSQTGRIHITHHSELYKNS